MKAFTTKSCRNLLCVFCLMLGAAVYGQNITVNGTVTDKTGQPLIGAAVTVKSDQNTRGVSTDADGNFTLTVRPNAVLTVSYVGYKTKTVQVPREGDRLFITLEDDATAVEDVVVVGFGTQKKESVVGAIGTIKATELSVPVRSLNNSIGGRVAGVIAV